MPAINIQNILNSQVSSGGGVSLPKLGGSINLHQLQDRSGFGVDGELEVPVIPGMPDITIDIGFVGVASIVDQSRLIGLELLNGIKYSRAVKRMPINATAVLSKDPQTKSSFVKVGNTITGTGEQFSAVGISNFRIGSSPASQIVTFNKLVIELPADFVKSKMVDMIGKIKATNPAESSVPLVKLTSANFQMSSGTNLMFECTSLVNNPVKGLSLDIGTLELQLLLDDSTLVALKISPIQLSQGQSPLTLKVYMKLSDGSNNMDQKVATLVDVVVNKNINSNLLVGVTGIRMSPANANPEAIVDQVSDMKVNIAIGKILSELGSGDAAPRPSALDITALVPSIDLDLKNLFSVSSAQVAALSGQILSLSSNLNYRNPIPVSASIPFFTIDTIVDGSRIVTTAVTGIEIVQIQGEFQPKINLNFNNDASVPDKVESLYNQLDLKKISSKLEIGGLSFGTEEMKNQLFRFVKLDATSYLQIILDKAPSTTNFDPMAVKLITVNLDKSLQVATEFTKTKEIRIDAKLPLNSSISIELNIPYFRIDSYLDDSEAFSIGLNDLNTKLVTGQTQPLGINIVIGVHDTEDLSWSIAKLVDSVLKSEKLTGRAGVGGFKIGVSEHDYITAFYKLRVIKEIDLIGGQIIRDIMRSPPNLPQVPQLSLLSEMVTLQNVNIEALIQKAIAVNINAHVANPMNISVKGLNYISNSVGINKAEVVFVELNALNDLVVKAGPNNISIGLNMKFSGERISKQMVNTLYQESLEKLGEQKSIFTTTGIQFGVDKENSFKFLSRTVLAYNSNKVINDESVTQVKSIIFAARKNSTLPIAFKLNEVDVEFSPEKSIDSKVKANIELPFDVTVDVPFIKFGSKLNEHRFFDVGILGATTKATSNYIEFTTSLEFHDTPDIASSIEKLVSEYSVSESSTTLVGRLGSQLEVGRDGKFEILETPKEIGSGSILMKRIIDNILGTIGGGFISFGIDATPENLIDIFDQLSLDMSSRDVINTALSMVPSFNGSSSTPIDNLNLALKNLKGGTAPGRIVKSSFTAQFSNDIGVNISLKGFGFLSVVSGVAGDKGAAAVTALQLGGLSILPGNNSIDMNAELFFPPSPNVIDIVGDFSKNILNNFGHTREKLFATGLRFGHSAESSFQFLSKAKFGVESSKFINAHMLQKLISGHNFTAPSADAFGISNVKIISSSTGAIVIDSSATVKSVPFTADASIGFLKATTIIDQKP